MTRSQESEGRQERWEIPLGEVTLSESERRDVLRVHRRIDGQWCEVWDEAANDLVEKLVPLPEPICGRCREPWGKYGCPTVRAVSLLAILEREERKHARRNEELNEALTPRFGVHHLRDTKNQRIELKMYVDEYTLIHGGLDLVTATLKRMHDEWRRWFANVGEKRRMQTDHFYAVAMLEHDPVRSGWILDDFDATASAFKRPEAPWDDPSWTIATTPRRAAAPSPTVEEERAK